MAVKVLLTIVLVAALSVVWGMWWDNVQKAEVEHFPGVCPSEYILETRPVGNGTLKMSCLDPKTGKPIWEIGQMKRRDDFPINSETLKMSWAGAAELENNKYLHYKTADIEPLQERVIMQENLQPGDCLKVTPSETVIKTHPSDCLAAAAGEPGQWFYITIPGVSWGYKVFARNRIDAVTKIAMTVWTEAEWKECGEMCSKVTIRK